MLEVLQHFGSPDAGERHEPQQLLAIPCDRCDPQSLLPVASEGVESTVIELARQLRPDINVALRAFHLKQAVEQLGGDLLRLEGYYCLSGVQLPFGQQDIDASSSSWERHWREDICNQIDLCVTAGSSWPEECTAMDAAKRALGECCGIRISEELWEEDVQRGLRRSVGAEGLKLYFVDANCMRVMVMLLPADAEIMEDDGVLCFEGAADVDYAAADVGEGDVAAAPVEAVAVAPSAPQRVVPQKPVPASAPPAAPPQATPAPARPAPARPAPPAAPAGKTANDWERDQDKFDDTRPLPPGWMRIKSKSSGDVYFFNKQTQESKFEFPEWPLPEGWTKQKSKSTGKVYYFNAQRKQSTFERPTA